MRYHPKKRLKHRELTEREKRLAREESKMYLPPIENPHITKINGLEYKIYLN